MKKHKAKLKKELGLGDVFAISTGAMFSSGFFLLPGLAFMKTGPSVVLAYFASAFLIMPAMFSIAELSTALPRSGGSYYLIDRSLGPRIGTIGGLGTYMALLFKSVFALIGIGAYSTIVLDLPIKPTAIAFTIIFMIFNIVGAKETTRLQKFFVIILIITLGYFIIEGLSHVFLRVEPETLHQRFSGFFKNGSEGFFATIGFVFVSYIGLTKVSSVAEEIKNPEKNIPLGMILSLVVTGLIYTVGVFIIVGVMDGKELCASMTPVEDAGLVFFKWIPLKIGTIIILAAAIAAFASTGNAGLMSASRYPMAMSRDKLLPAFFSKIGRFNTPYWAVIFSSILMIVFILIFNEEGIAKLAGSFQLIIFILINFSVIIMRSSKIDSYDPGYHSPLYPWMQIFGIVTSFALIIYMGWMAILFCAGIFLMGLLWYVYYVKNKVVREGAIYHWFALLGQRRYSDLEREMLEVLREKGLRADDPFDEMILDAKITFFDGQAIKLNYLVHTVTNEFSERFPLESEGLFDQFMKTKPTDPIFVTPNVAFFHARMNGLIKPHLSIVISGNGIKKAVSKHDINSEDCIHIFFFLVSPEKSARQQLRLLSRLADSVDRLHFVKDMLQKKDEIEVKEFLLHYERFYSLELLANTTSAELIGKKLKDISMPADVLIALINRNEQIYTPRGNTVLLEGDRLTIIGEPDSINELFKRYQK